MMNDLCITDGKGFAMKFANGYSISVQFGRGNYCDNYSFDNGSEYPQLNIDAGSAGSSNAECAVIDPSGDLIQLPDFMGCDDVVSNRSNPDLILKLMNWAASK